MTAYEYIKNHINTKLQPSVINGVGVFALRNIQKGEELFKLWEGESGEYTLTDTELDSLDYNVKEHLLNMYGYKEIDGKYTMFVILNKHCHWIFKTPLHWVNSCNWAGEPNIDRETLTANRFIKKGEEILLKYGKYNKFRTNKII
jgi:SET domain-containing protein